MLGLVERKVYVFKGMGGVFCFAIYFHKFLVLIVGKPIVTTGMQPARDKQRQELKVSVQASKCTFVNYTHASMHAFVFGASRRLALDPGERDGDDYHSE